MEFDNENNIYGSKFRKLRKLQKINLITASKGVTNKSTLSEWENGKDNLSWNQVLALLYNIHVQPVEFIESSIFLNLYSSIKAIGIAYANNDVNSLQKYAKLYLKDYQQEDNDQDALFRVAMACNYYEDLTRKSILSSDVKARLILHFSDIITNDNHWYYKDIFYFSSITQLLDAAHLYSFSLSLIDYIQEKNIKSKTWYDLPLDTLLNAVFSLIKKDRFKAEQLLDRLNNLDVIDYYAEESIRKKFMECLIRYIKSNNPDEIYNLFSYLDFFDLKQQKKDLEIAFLQVKKIYFG